MQRGARLLLVMMCLPGAFARAQPAGEPSARERALARSEFQVGVEAAREERWADAHASFERAYSLVSAPEILLNLATAQVRTGRLVEGVESYRLFQRVAPAEMLAAQQDAVQAALEEAIVRIAHLTIETPGIQPVDTLFVNGAPLAQAAIGAPLPVNPGPHELAVQRESRTIVERSLTVSEGERRSVELLVPAILADVVAPDPDPVREDPTSERRIVRSPIFWTIVGVVALGAVALGLYFALRDDASFPGSFSGMVVRVR